MATKPRRRWQFTLRTFFIAVAVIAIGTYYGTHFWRMTIRARRHLSIIQQPIILLTFMSPEQINADADLRRWHESKASECLAARWFPWRQVDESIPQPHLHTVPIGSDISTPTASPR